MMFVKLLGYPRCSPFHDTELDSLRDLFTWKKVICNACSHLVLSQRDTSTWSIIGEIDLNYILPQNRGHLFSFYYIRGQTTSDLIRTLSMRDQQRKKRFEATMAFKQPWRSDLTVQWLGGIPCLFGLWPFLDQMRNTEEHLRLLKLSASPLLISNNLRLLLGML